MENGMWKRDIAICDDDATFTQNKLRFLEKCSDGEAITVSKKYNIRNRPLELVNSVNTLIQAQQTTGVYHNTFVIEGKLKSPVLVTISCRDRTNEDYEEQEFGGRTHRDSFQTATQQQKIVTYFVEITGHRQDIQSIFGELDKIYGREHLAQIKWWYSEGKRNPTYKAVFLNPITTKLRPEFYPTLDNPKVFLERYLASDASVLLIAGAPGTGKTTLLRHLVSDYRLAAHIVYDEALMETDEVFQNFLFSEESDILIIEDADVILMARERSDNKLMARFLSVSDGLIKLPNKRLVFTTNLTDFSKVDQALVRPGRCFGSIHTRALTYDEAITAAKVAGIKIPTEHKEYTIAELFNQRQPTEEIKLRTVGFRG